MDGTPVEHVATVHYQRLAAGYIYGPMEVQRAELTVISPPDDNSRCPGKDRDLRGRRESQ